MYPATPVRLVAMTGTRHEVVVMWDGCAEFANLHVARGPITKQQWDDRDYRHPWDGAACQACQQPVPWDATMPCDCGDPGCNGTRSALRWSAGEQTVFDTPTGKPGPGDMYYGDWNVAREGREHYCSGHWDNCDGRHLYVVLPNGHPWDIDSRASNCTLPEDRTHRCWVRTGEPPNVTAGKTGPTCSAGAGSILSGDYHGFLVDGVLTAG